MLTFPLPFALLLVAEPGIVEPLSVAPEASAEVARALQAPALDVEGDSPNVRGPQLAPPQLLAGDVHQRRRSYLLAALETGALFVGGTIWYWDRTWYSSESNWDLHFDWTSWSKKLDLSAIRFDTDRYSTSATDHPRAGIGYYQAARGNGLGFAESYAWVFATEVAWAYFVEWDELPSLNDMIMTPQSGTVVGESLFRLGEFFDASAPTIANRLGALIFSPFAAVNDLSSGRSAPRRGPFDDYGFTQTIEHQFQVSFEGLASDLDGRRSDLASVAVDTRLASLAGRPGSGWLTVWPGERTELDVRVLAAKNGVQGTNFHSSTLFMGRYLRHYAAPRVEGASSSERPSGWGLLLGLGTDFDYNTRQLSFVDDRVVSSGLLGPMFDLAFNRGRFGIRMSLSTFYSLAIVQSLAYPSFGAPSTLPSNELSTPLSQWGYYYGQGPTSFASLDVRAGMVEVSANAYLGAYWSINAWDRYQERLRDELSPSDLRSAASATLSLKPTRSPLKIAATVEGDHRSGQLAGRSAVSNETRAGAGIAFAF
jgi:hypothetical protein